MERLIQVCVFLGAMCVGTTGKIILPFSLQVAYVMFYIGMFLLKCLADRSSITFGETENIIPTRCFQY